MLKLRLRTTGKSYLLILILLLFSVSVFALETKHSKPILPPVQLLWNSSDWDAWKLLKQDADGKTQSDKEIMNYELRIMNENSNKQQPTTNNYIQNQEPRTKNTEENSDYWWTENTGTPLTLDDCIILALENNEEIISSEEDINTAYTNVKLIKAQQLPQMKFSSSYTKFDQSLQKILEKTRDISVQLPTTLTIPPISVNVPIIGSVTIPQTTVPLPAIPLTVGLPPLAEDSIFGVPNQYNMEFSAGQILYSGGRIENAKRQAKLGVEINKINLEIKKKETVYKVTRAFYNVLKSNLLVKLAKRQVDWTEKKLQDVEKREKRGQSIPLETTKTIAELSGAKNAEFESQMTKKAALIELKSFIGIPLDKAITLESESVESILSSIDFSHDELVKTEYRKNPEKQSLVDNKIDELCREITKMKQSSYSQTRGFEQSRERLPLFRLFDESTCAILLDNNVKKLLGESFIVSEKRLDKQIIDLSTTLAEKGVKLTDSAFRPTMTVGTVKTYTGSEFPPDNSNYSWSIRMDYNLFDGGARNAEKKKAQVNLRKAQMDNRKITQAMEIDQERMKLSLKMAKDKISNALNNLEYFKELKRVTDVKYKLGKVGELDYIGIEIALLKAEADFKSSIYDYETAEAEYVKTFD